MSVPAPGSDVWNSSWFWQPARRYGERVSGRPESMFVTDGPTSRSVGMQDSGLETDMAGKGIEQKTQTVSKKPESLSQANSTTHQSQDTLHPLTHPRPAHTTGLSALHC